LVWGNGRGVNLSSSDEESSDSSESNDTDSSKNDSSDDEQEWNVTWVPPMSSLAYTINS
jgi:hypothetical protein